MILKSGQDHINYQRIEQAIRYLEENFLQQPDLDAVAEKVHLSPFHFQRIFTEWAGISPKRFLQHLTIGYLKQKLLESRSVLDAAEAAGLSAQSRVYDLFTTLEAVTPQQYREQGLGVHIDYGFHTTMFGTALIGVTRRGVCWLSFPDLTVMCQTGALAEMTAYWPHSSFRENPFATGEVVEKIFNPYAGQRKLHVLVKGTNFQVKVWEALLRIPMGEVVTYQDIARIVGSPRALQTVGSAVGANHVAYLIPCHRVIRKDGVLGQYRWSPARKKAMIGWELAKANNPPQAPNKH